MTKQEAIKHIQNNIPNGEHVCMILWTREDVQEYGKKEMEPPVKISNKDADMILDNIEREHDAAIGINWFCIEDEIELLTRRRKE